MGYIHEKSRWPTFEWDEKSLSTTLAAVRHRQGRFLGRMETLGFSLKTEAQLSAMTREAVKSSEIEEEILPADQVRSSLARRLGVDAGGLASSDRRVEGVVEMLLDATQRGAEPLTRERLYSWHKALFPSEAPGLIVGAWRNDAAGPMRVISGPAGREKVHFVAPEAARLDTEMERFLSWDARETSLDPVLKAAVAHLWLVTIHPFEDGNGRIARAVADRQLAISEGSRQRFYSMSAQIRAERKDYYEILERTQKGDLDITEWLLWFLGCLDRAFTGSEAALTVVLAKHAFWKEFAGASFNARQRLMIDKLLEGFEGKLTSSKWATIAKCSQDTASRDIDGLIALGVLAKDAAGGRSTSYSLRAF